MAIRVTEQGCLKIWSVSRWLERKLVFPHKSSLQKTTYIWPVKYQSYKGTEQTQERNLAGYGPQGRKELDMIEATEHAGTQWCHRVCVTEE